MARSEQLRNAQADAWAGQVEFVSFHTADPGTDGSFDSGITHVAVTFTGSAADGTVVSDDIEVEIPAGTILTHVGFWDGSSHYLDSMMNNVTFEQTTTYTFTVVYVENEEAA